MQNPEKTTSYALGALIILVVIYWIWPYVEAFLALVGAFQIYRLWKLHHGK